MTNKLTNNKPLSIFQEMLRLVYILPFLLRSLQLPIKLKKETNLKGWAILLNCVRVAFLMDKMSHNVQNSYTGYENYLPATTAYGGVIPDSQF